MEWGAPPATLRPFPEFLILGIVLVKIVEEVDIHLTQQGDHRSHADQPTNTKYSALGVTNTVTTHMSVPKKTVLHFCRQLEAASVNLMAAVTLPQHEFCSNLWRRMKRDELFEEVSGASDLALDTFEALMSEKERKDDNPVDTFEALAMDTKNSDPDFLPPDKE